MKKIVRRGTFETNSSSSHSLTWCTEKQFEDWQNGELYVNSWDDEFYTKEEYDKLVEETAKDNDCTIEEVLENLGDFDLPKSWEEFCDDEYLEVDSYEYTTEHGDKIIAVCKHGYCG